MLLLVLTVTAAAHAQKTFDRWSERKANGWYAQQPWLVGSNYIPADAINEMEMFQKETFNPRLIDKELGIAESIGMNTMRVFLQDQLYLSDPQGFKSRLDQFLTITSRHHIKPVLVLFDSCWEPNPHLGAQHPPIPGVHNSGWVQSPGADRLADKSVEPELKKYVQGVVNAFGKDDRVLLWDVWNEPNNDNGGRFHENGAAKVARVNELLPKVFEWACEEHPTQPLTSAVWSGDWSHADKESATTKIQLADSDVISFHNYDWPESFLKRIDELKPLHRPIICTEYMARGNGSTFDTILPIGKNEHVALINWGFVAGKTQTYFPWDSWQRPYTLQPPTLWFHEVFKQDETPYRGQEVELIRYYTGRGTPLTDNQKTALMRSMGMSK
jgi:hypothetical protein